MVRFRILGKKRSVSVLREWPGAEPGRQVGGEPGTPFTLSCPEGWLGVDWGGGGRWRMCSRI